MTWRERWQECRKLRREYMRLVRKIKSPLDAELYGPAIVMLVLEHNETRLWWMRPLSAPIHWSKRGRVNHEPRPINKVLPFINSQDRM